MLDKSKEEIEREFDFLKKEAIRICANKTDKKKMFISVYYAGHGKYILDMNKKQV